MSVLTIVGPRKVRVSAAGVKSFNRGWPCSTLRDRAYWFEFEENRSLVDTDMPHEDDGPAAEALAGDCEAWLFDAIEPDWAP